MKYRSFNEELLIATALLINVFNDIVIDRRKHGVKRDFSKAISLKEIAQQEIEIPCILGERSHILRSLENEAGKYKLPLIILSNKSIKTDTVRMVDLHSDVFYQQDNQFYDLDPSDPKYKPQQISKRRAQPVNLEFDMTILTKYKEDMDQILGNWIVHFKPDVYVKWWSPRRKGETINSQILWNHNVSHELPIEYNPTNVFTYKATTSFTFKTWMFPGMHSVENQIENDTVIKKFKFYPNRNDWWDEEETASGIKDSNFEDVSYSFGDLYENDMPKFKLDKKTNNLINLATTEIIEPSFMMDLDLCIPINPFTGERLDPSDIGLTFDQEINQYIDLNTGTVFQHGQFGYLDKNSGKLVYSDDEYAYDPEDLYYLKPIQETDEGQLGFWGVSADQEFYDNGTDHDGIKAGKYAVNNVFARNYSDISGNPSLSAIHVNKNAGDFFSNYDRGLYDSWKHYQVYLTADDMRDTVGTAFIKNVYFKGGFDMKADDQNFALADPLFGCFYKSTIANQGTSSEKIHKTEFGTSFVDTIKMKLNYDIDTKNMSLTSSFDNGNYLIEASSIFNSQRGIFQRLAVESIKGDLCDKIRFNFERVCDQEFNIIHEKTKNQTKNVVLFNKLIHGRSVRFFIEESDFKNTSQKLLNVLNVYKKSIDLNEIKLGEFEMIINDSKIGSILNSKGLLNLPFRTFSLAYEIEINKFLYQVFLNKEIYLVVKTNINNENDNEIYDIGRIAPLKFSPDYAPIFEVENLDSKILLGFCFDMEI